MDYMNGRYELGPETFGFRYINFKSFSGGEHRKLLSIVLRIKGQPELDEQLQKHCKAVLTALNTRQTPSTLQWGRQQKEIDSLTEDNELLLKFVATLLEDDATHAEIFKLAHQMGVTELIGDIND
jgi:hypothetical protein